jgi:hypothetical protein
VILLRDRWSILPAPTIKDEQAEARKLDQIRFKDTNLLRRAILADYVFSIGKMMPFIMNVQSDLQRFINSVTKERPQ